MDLHMDNIYKYRRVIDCLNKIKQFSKISPHMEICGFLGFDINEGKFVAKLENNCSTDPVNFFAIDALKYLLFKEEYSMVCVFHSHIIGDENPSEFDIKMSENCCIPFLVYSLNTDKFKIHEPISLEYNKEMLDKIKDKL